MAGFFDRAREQAQRGLAQGKEKVEEVQAQREGKELLRRLGSAYYAQQRGRGSQQAVDQHLRELDQHIEKNGDAFLR
ncbi:hypothetical protein [Streptomyces gobiensis]|uniref:hypothetical protein n=1 Tax=Streptomyces gobiensis TaxID=2875706 RepID=UPI001E45A04C|nr:hypothetical protein [Streptomyces gobiensis]UGY93567.1 hypothetical protein test1122_18805 [Streptomyces gobiensis]